MQIMSIPYISYQKIYDLLHDFEVHEIYLCISDFSKSFDRIHIYYLVK